MVAGVKRKGKIKEGENEGKKTVVACAGDETAAD
jgi:hypothetical protein